MPNDLEQSVFAEKALLPGGWSANVRLTILAGQVKRVETGVSRGVSDLPVKTVIPGLCNVHSHAFQRALAGHTEQRSPAGRDNFWTWRERMYRLAGQVDAEALTSIARQVYTEMLMSGYTSVVEFHYLHRDPGNADAVDTMFDAIKTAAGETGIRLTYVPVHYERAGFNEPKPQSHQRSFVQTLDEFIEHYGRAQASGNDTVNVGIGVHSLRAVTAESLQAIAAIANEQFVPMHLHIAEQQQEVEQSVSAYGLRPVQWLFEYADPGANWCLVHATHMDDSEIEAVAESKAVVGLCPSTEANLGDGIFPLRSFLAHEGRIAIGSDSHVSINPFEELRWLEYGQRLVTQSRNVAAFRESHVGSELFSRALQGGAAASGQGDAGIREGSSADFVVLDGNDPMLMGHGDNSRLDALVFSGYPLPVERVMVNGVWQVNDAVHVDRDRARQAFGDAVDRINRSGTAT